MTTDSASEIYKIEIEYTDAGFSLGFDMAEWSEKIENDFTSFEAIMEFYRTSSDEFRERLLEGFREIEPEETTEGPGIVIDNPPKEWKEDPSRAAPFLEIAHRQMVQMGLGVLMEDEVNEEEILLEQNHYKPLVVRQSAFYEDLLTFRSLLALQDQKGETLSSSELDIIENLGHRDRLRLAHLFGEINEEEHGLLQEMASWRNQIAHTPWPEFDSRQESQIQSIAERVHGLLKAEIEEAREYWTTEGTQASDDNFDIGFDGLDVDLQNLQLSVLDIVRKSGGLADLSHIQNILPRENEMIKQRCYRMDHIGYLELDDGLLRITDKGEELLGKYWDIY